MCNTLLRSNKWKVAMLTCAVVSEDLQQTNLLPKIILLGKKNSSLKKERKRNKKKKKGKMLIFCASRC